MRQRALSREERKLQILTAFTLDLQSGGEGEMTVYDIARALDLTPSTKLRRMVLELVGEGDLKRRDEPIGGEGAIAFRSVFSLPEQSGFRVSPQTAKRRTITLRSRQRTEQMELWA